jgi:hypothetical protein
MDALNHEFVGNERQIAAIEKDYGAKEREVIEIEGQIKIADEFKKTELEAVRRDLQADLRSLAGDWRTLKRENKGISKDYFALKKERSGVEARLKDEGARQAQNKLDDRARQTDFNRDWGTRIGQAADKLGIPKDAKIREHFDLAMTDKAIAVVPLLPGQRISDIDAFLEEHGKQYVAVMKSLGGAEIKKFSNVKLADAQRSAQRAVPPSRRNRLAKAAGTGSRRAEGARDHVQVAPGTDGRRNQLSNSLKNSIRTKPSGDVERKSRSGR